MDNLNKLPQNINNRPDNHNHKILFVQNDLVFYVWVFQFRIYTLKFLVTSKHTHTKIPTRLTLLMSSFFGLSRQVKIIFSDLSKMKSPQM